MSAGTDSRAGWLEQNYEKIALVVVLLGLLVSAAILVLRIRQGHRLLVETDRGIPAGRQAGLEPVDLRLLDEAKARLLQPPVAGERPQRLWVSELRVHCVECQKPIEYDAMRCPFCDAEQPDPSIMDPETFSSAGDGIPDQWKEQFGLDPLDPYLHLRDLDGDGFTVMEEYRAGTDPTDPEDFPPPVMKLRLEATRSIPFKLRFQAVQEIVEGEPRFQLNMRTLDRTFFARLGDVVEGYRVDSYDPERRTVYVVQNDRRIALRRGEVQEEVEREIRLRSLLDGETIDTRVGQIFSIRDVQYNVFELLSDGVRVQEVTEDEDGVQFSISRLTQEERAALQRGPRSFGPGELDEYPEGYEEVPEALRRRFRPDAPRGDEW